MRSLLAAVLLAAGAAAEDCSKLMSQARAAFDARRFERAAEALEKAKAGCPNAGDLLISLGQTRFLLGDQPAAEAAFREAISRNPKNTAALYHLGRLYYHQQRYPEAIATFQKVVAIEPGHYRAHDNLGLCFDAVQQDAQALRHFFRALDLVVKDHPQYDWAHANLADFFLKREQYEKAFQLAAEAAQRNPQSARNAFLTGKSLTKLNKPEVSLRWLEQAVKLDPAHTEALYLLSQTYRKLGRTEDAARMLERFRQASKPAGK